MAARSIASLTLSFGLVNVPVKLYSATESAGTVRFNLLAADGSRLKQQYVSESTGKVVERAEMVKGYEFEKDRFVLFTPDELKALDEAASHVIDIVAFVPEKSVDPIFYDRAYFLAPDKRGGKPYSLLAEAMRESGRCALARWTSKGKQYVVQVRAAEDGLILQQLLYAAEVRSMKDLGIEAAAVSQPELALAKQLIDQISKDAYDPAEFKDEEKERVLAAIDEKIAGKQVVASARAEEPVASGQVIDLMDALRASLGKGAKAAPAKAAKAEPEAAPAAAAKERKPVRRAPKVEEAVEAEAPGAGTRPSEEVTARPGDAPYTLKHLEEMLGLSRSVVSGLVSAGFVAPARGPRNELRFTFQDVVLLRTAFHLRAARIPPRRLLRSLKQLRERLPAELPLSGLRIKAIGNDVAVKDGNAQWDAVSGQLLMDFEVTAQQGSVAFLPREPKLPGPAAGAGSADDWFSRGERLEASDAAAAETAYRQALTAAPGHVYAALNLGAMLCEAGRCGEAVRLFESTLERRPAEPLLHFNAAIALEDLHREAEALAHYARCLELDPEFADAHYNAAKLHEKLGDRRSALRHLSAYRRLQLAITS